jgi:cytochrome P450
MSLSAEIFDLAIARVRAQLASALEELESVDDPAPGPDLIGVAQAVSQALVFIDALLAARAKRRRSRCKDQTPLELRDLLFAPYDPDASKCSE